MLRWLALMGWGVGMVLVAAFCMCGFLASGSGVMSVCLATAHYYPLLAITFWSIALVAV
jgi:hypothetical protein